MISPFVFRHYNVYCHTTYARYGSYYVEVLQKIADLYPELKSTLMLTGLSIQAQDRYPLRISIDQRGEQTTVMQRSVVVLVVLLTLLHPY